MVSDLGTDKSRSVSLIPLKRIQKFESHGFDGLMQRLHTLGAFRKQLPRARFLIMPEMQCHSQIFARQSDSSYQDLGGSQATLWLELMVLPMDFGRVTFETDLTWPIARAGPEPP
jgi:hypothetical protein